MNGLQQSILGQGLGAYLSGLLTRDSSAADNIAEAVDIVVHLRAKIIATRFA